MDLDRRNFLKYAGIASIAGGLTLANAKDVLASTVLTNDYVQADEIKAPTGRSATLVVAASDSSAKSKAQADYVCDGTDDQVEINAAIRSLPLISNFLTNIYGGEIVLLEGKYNISAPIQIDRNVHIRGISSESTVLYLADGANCNIIEFIETVDNDPKALNILEKLLIYGNRTNQTATGLYGVYQVAGNSAIDIRFFDIWFDSIKGGAAISLGKYWNHHIEWCTFEHLTGSCIETRLSTPNAPNSMHIHHNFVTDVDNFISVYGSGAGASNCNVTNNILTNIHKDAVQIAGDYFVFCDNLVLSNYIEADTYSAININTDTYTRAPVMIEIENNIFNIGGSTNTGKHLLHLYGTYGVNGLTFRNNQCNGYGTTCGIFGETTGRVDNFMITGNSIDCVGVGIQLASTYRTKVLNNIFIHTSNSLVVNSNNLSMRIQGNDLGSAISGALGTNGRISDNLGYKTEGTGNATLVSGQTTVNVNHNLVAAPTRVLLSPTTATAGKQYYVSDKAATTFTITIDSPAEAGISFDWQAVV